MISAEVTSVIDPDGLPVEAVDTVSHRFFPGIGYAGGGLALWCASEMMLPIHARVVLFRLARCSWSCLTRALCARVLFSMLNQVGDASPGATRM
jgi:hypothetical protein